MFEDDGFKSEQEDDKVVEQIELTKIVDDDA